MQGLVGLVQNVKLLSYECKAIAKFQASVCVFWLKNGEQIGGVQKWVQGEAAIAIILVKDYEDGEETKSKGVFRNVKISQLSDGRSEVSSFCNWILGEGGKFMRKHVEWGVSLRYLNGDVNQIAWRRDLGVIRN